MKRLVIAALPRELKRLTLGWNRVASELPGVTLWTRGDVIAACGGMGRDRATLAFQEAITAAGGAVTELVSFGLAGACSSAAAVGEALWCSTIVDARSGERFGSGTPTLVSLARIAGVTEKRRLLESYGALLVDMEAATLARLAEARGIHFRALKGVSDGPEAAMENMERFATKQGGFSEGRFAAYVALRPGIWRSAVELGRASTMALRRGTEILEAALREG